MRLLEPDSVVSVQDRPDAEDDRNADALLE
jgi:hypothetical protein